MAKYIVNHSFSIHEVDSLDHCWHEMYRKSLRTETKKFTDVIDIQKEAQKLEELLERLHETD